LQQRRNKYVFSLFLNTDSDEADITSLSRPLLQQQERHDLRFAVGQFAINEYVT